MIKNLNETNKRDKRLYKIKFQNKILFKIAQTTYNVRSWLCIINFGKGNRKSIGIKFFQHIATSWNNFFFFFERDLSCAVFVGFLVEKYEVEKYRTAGTRWITVRVYGFIWCVGQCRRSDEGPTRASETHGL